MLNGFLQSQSFPKNTHFDIHKPSETLSNLINHAVKKNLMVDINSMPYVKPAVSYIKDVLKLGKNREYLQKMNTTELSNKLTDTLNLEVNDCGEKDFLRYKKYNLVLDYRASIESSSSLSPRTSRAWMRSICALRNQLTPAQRDAWPGRIQIGRTEVRKLRCIVVH